MGPCGHSDSHLCSCIVELVELPDLVVMSVLEVQRLPIDIDLQAGNIGQCEQVFLGGSHCRCLESLECSLNPGSLHHN